MAPTRRTVLGAAAATIGLGGCVGGSGDGGDSGDPSDPSPARGGYGGGRDDAGDTTDEPMTAAGGAAGSSVRVDDHPDLGQILVGADGMTLYMFDSGARDAGASTCHEGCAETWPPLSVDGTPSAGGSVTAALSTFEREDGSTQVAADGWPLYYFASDESPGDASGQGVSDVWWVLDPSGAPVRGT